jgi:hypothetical protein
MVLWQNLWVVPTDAKEVGRVFNTKNGPERTPMSAVFIIFNREWTGITVNWTMAEVMFQFAFIRG